MNDTTWSTIVGTWRPGRLELYVDGFSRASSTAAATNTSALFGIYRWVVAVCRPHLPKGGVIGDSDGPLWGSFHVSF